MLTSAVCLTLTSASLAVQDDSMQKLQERFKQRFEQIRELKSAGKIGETFDGNVAWVKGEDSSAAKLVEQENADRRELYQLIAAKEKTSPDLVARRNAQRNFEKAAKGEYLKGQDGQWKQKS
jgi:uncharacterized protein YdbL (DUF1318 family)